MKRLFFFISLIFATFACQRETKKQIENLPEITDFSKIVLKSPIFSTSSLHNVDYLEPNSVYPAWYIGECKDSLNLLADEDTLNHKMADRYDTENLVDKKAQMELLERFLRDTSSNKTPPSEPKWFYHSVTDTTKLQIFVDTSRNIIFRQYEIGTDKLSKPYSFYPVFLKNMEKDTLILAYGYSKPEIALFLEAKNKNGEWKPLQEAISFWCGTGLNQYALLPNHIAVSGVKIFKGNFKTELRLAYRICNTSYDYSNVFLGNINEKQFEKSENCYYRE